LAAASAREIAHQDGRCRLQSLEVARDLLGFAAIGAVIETKCSSRNTMKRSGID
jgi:hypothetical protein